MIKTLIPVGDSFLFTQESAYALTQMLSRYDASVMIHDRTRTVNAKSLLGILSLGYFQSSEIEFILDGVDEEKAAEQIRRHFHLS